MNDKLTQAEQLFSQGKLTEAVHLLRSLLKEQPDSAEAYNGLGTILWQQGEVEQATQALQQALSLQPGNKDAALNLAEVLKVQERLGDAVKPLALCLEQHPGDAELSDLLRQAQAVNSSQPKIIKRNFSDDDPLGGARVLHAPFEIAGVMGRFSRLLREHGVNATSANYYGSWLNYHCDVNLNVNALPEKEAVAKVDEFARRAMDEYDIFHFHFAQSLYLDMHELPELKERGKKILFSFWGSDSRSVEVIFYHQARFLGYDPPAPYFHNWEQFLRMKYMNQYADVFLGITCLPRYLFFPGFADTKEWSLEEKQRLQREYPIDKDPEKLYVLHAPSANWKKGSQLILDVLEQLKKKGLPIEVLYVSQVAPDEARRLYAHADVAVDQVSIGTFGLFGIEMMCWETPLIVYSTEELNRDREDPPILPIEKRNDLVATIERCVEMKRSGELGQLGAKSREWAVSQTDARDTIPEHIKIYQTLLDGKPVKQHVDLDWFRQEALLLKGEKNDFYRYMIESGAFAALGHNVSAYDKRLYT